MNDYTKIDPALIEQVKGVLAEADRHKYSVSRVYGAYNKAFKKNDKPQTCSSCLRNRVRELGKWYAGYNKYKTSLAEPIKAEKPLENKEEFIEPSLPESYIEPGVRAFSLEGDQVLHFNTGDGEARVTNGTKGTVLYEDGTKVKAGTYKTDTGDEIAVQPGGKATFKEKEGNLL